jgi:hypothetical protein
MSAKLTFEEAKGYLDAIGISYRQVDEYRGAHPPRTQVLLPLFKTVLLPFTPEEWCSLCMNEGDNYIGGCCGNTSAAQDILEHFFRHDSGWVQIRGVGDNGLESMADICANHDEMSNAKVEWAKRPNIRKLLGSDPKATWATLGVWDKLALLWHIVRDNYDAEAPHAQRNRDDNTPEKRAFEKAAWTVEHVLRSFSYDRLFKSDESNPQYEARFRMSVHRLIPALNAVHTSLHTFAFPPTEYLALIEVGVGPEAVAENRRGLCLFADEDGMKELLGIWRQSEDAQTTRRAKKVDQKFKLRKVRISMDKGLEFLSDLLPLPK